MFDTNTTLTKHLDTHPGVKFDLGGTLTLTNSPETARFATNAITATAAVVNLLPFSQVRLRGLVTTASASANTPEVELVAIAAYSATFGDYDPISDAAGGVALSLATAGAVDTGWLDIDPAIKSANTVIALAEQGGDGAEDPVIVGVYAEFR